MIDEEEGEMLGHFVKAVRLKGDIPEISDIVIPEPKVGANSVGHMNMIKALHRNELAQIRHCSIPQRGPCDGPLVEESYGLGAPAYADQSLSSDSGMTFVVQG